MSECSVLRCTSAADEIFFVEGPVEEAMPVCENHKDAMDTGEDWALQPPDERAGRPANMLLGEDLPWRVLAASAVHVQGNRSGLILHLTISHSGESKDLQLLVPWDEANVLTGLMNA